MRLGSAIRCAILALAFLAGTAARAEMSPGDAALLSATVTIAGVAAGTAIATAGALKSDTWDPRGTTSARIAAGSVIGGLALLLGPSVGRFATATPSGRLVLFRAIVLGVGGIAAAVAMDRRDATGANAAAAGIFVAPMTGLILAGAAAYDIGTTPADVRDSRGIEVHPLPGGVALAFRY